MIEAVHLSRSFGSLRAVDELSFTVEPGEAVGFLGPNGAGKTTTFRMLAGIVGPSSGQVRIFGHDMAEAPLEAKAKLGFMPENAPLYPEMTAEEYLLFRAELKGVSGRKARQKEALRALERAHCRSAQKTLIGHLSKGFRQRVALAEVLLGNPPALLLDEPTAGLDPNQVSDVRDLIRELASDHAVLVSTHVLREVEATCSRAIVLRQGRMVAQGALAELGQTAHPRSYFVTLGELAAVAAALAPSLAQSDVSLASQDERRVRVEAQKGQDVTELVDLARRARLPVEEAGTSQAALEQAFRRLTVGES